MGKRLAAEAPIEADVVTGVPDSSISAAIGYAEATGIPYELGLIKNRYVGRTFIQPSQELREQGVKMKLSAVRGVVEGKRVVMIDDSIVRGTTSKRIVRMLREAGATEVHVRIASIEAYQILITHFKRSVIHLNTYVQSLTYVQEQMHSLQRSAYVLSQHLRFTNSSKSVDLYMFIHLSSLVVIQKVLAKCSA